MNTLSCHLCRSSNVEDYPEFPSLLRVTSDCRPWKRGGRLIQCLACGTVQALCDDTWRREIDEIYRHYDIYSQGGGEEQKVFDPSTGLGLSRSTWLLQELKKTASFPSEGRLLDIGCGNGGLLRAFHEAFPAWRLTGTELSDRYRARVEALPNVERMHAGPLEALIETHPAAFDCISLIHVLEHIENPLPFLGLVSRLLAPGGQLLVELPHYIPNPFELLIADHSSHFSLATASHLLGLAGFRPVLASGELIPKELTLLARHEETPSLSPPPPHDPALGASIARLATLASRAAEIQGEARKFGIFGSSIAASWLAASLPKPPDFFVDEDPMRIGHTLFGIPILPPDRLPETAEVFLPLAPLLAQKIASRLSGASARYHL